MAASHPGSMDDDDALLAALESEVGELTLARIEDVVDIARADSLIGSILRRDVDLKQVVEQNENQLVKHQDLFVGAHCEQAENFCKLYHEVTQCEAKLDDYEQQILAFQSRLTETAEDIVVMQQETVRVVHKVNNRKGVSNKLKEVYEALNECEAFCDSVTNMTEVNVEYLTNIRVLESKIAFLEDNPVLRDSAVYREINPKLRVAAQKAGDELHKFLMKKFQGLAELGTNLAIQQQTLERQGQYAYSFLHKYNRPIADDLLGSYTHIMNEAYFKQGKLLLRELNDVTPFSSRSFEPVISSEVRTQLATGTPAVSIDRRTSTSAVAPSVSQTRRSMSMSLGQRFRDKLREAPEKKREATFVDKVNALRAVSASSRFQVTLDPILLLDLKGSNCWIIRFAELLVWLLNAVINEARFTDHFFFASSANVDTEEDLLRSTLTKALQLVETSLQAECCQLTDVVTVLAAMRVVELLKNYVSQLSDPLPLLFLAATFEVTGTTLSGRLKSLLRGHLQSLQDVCSSKAVQIEKTPTPRVPDCVKRYAKISSEVHFVNSLKLEGSRVSAGSAATRTVFDEGCAGILSLCFEELRKLLGLISRNYDTAQRRVFSICSYAYLIFCYKAVQPMNLPETTIPTAASDQRQGSPSPQDSEMSFIASRPELQEMEAILNGEIQKFVRGPSLASPLNSVFDYVDAMSSKLGEDFFNDENAPPPSVSLDEATLIDHVSTFASMWTEALAQTAASTGKFFCQDPEDSEGLSEELKRTVLREYFRLVALRNARLHRIARSYFPNNGSLHSKLVGRHALLHEISKYLSS